MFLVRTRLSKRKYRIGFEATKGDAGYAIGPYLRNGKADRVCKAASLVCRSEEGDRGLKTASGRKVKRNQDLL